MRKAFFVLVGLAAVLAMEAQAGCNATVNGRPMTVQECELVRQIYGSYPRGHYLRDAQGNWVNAYDSSDYGNFYHDQRRTRGSGGTGHWSDGHGCVRTEFGSAC